MYSLVNTASKLEFWFPSEPPVCSILLDLCALGHQRWGSFGPDLIICDLSWFARQKEKSATPLPDGGDLVAVVVVTQGGVSPYYYYYAKNYVHSNPQYNEPWNSEFRNVVNSTQLPFWGFTMHITFDIVNYSISSTKRVWWTCSLYQGLSVLRYILFMYC